MFRVACLALSFVVTAFASSAEESELKRLDTGDDGRGWEAVGRLNLAGRGFCTGALIAPDLVLTAAHCLYDKNDGHRIDHNQIEFLAGWRNGSASAYRWVKRVAIHPDYEYDNAVEAERVRNDIALLQLHHPIKKSRVMPFETDRRPRKGQRIGVVSYAKGRSDAPALQEVCDVVGRQSGVLIMSCDVDFGSSGAPIFSFEGNQPRVVSVVSAMAELDGRKVSLGTQLEKPLVILRAELETRGLFQSSAPERIALDKRRDTGAKFSKP